MRRIAILLAIALQIGALAAIVVDKEWTLRNGRELVVQTAPIDPRDIFRGDFVRLDYLFSRLRADQIDPALHGRGLRRGEKVYLAMEPAPGGVARAKRLQRQKPPFPYLQGRVMEDWPYPGFWEQTAEQRADRGPGAGLLRVRYGIERLYVEQGKGRVLEEVRGGRDDHQRAMLVRLAVPQRGQALIRGYDWADLSVRTEVLRQPGANAPDERASAVIRLGLRNERAQTVALSLKPDGCSFALYPAGAAPADTDRLLPERSAFCAARKAEIRHIDPGQSLVIDVDFNQPQWWGVIEGKRQPLGRLPWEYRWRLVYRDALPEGLRGQILSRAFHAAGQVD